MWSARQLTLAFDAHRLPLQHFAGIHRPDSGYLVWVRELCIP